MSQPNSPPMSPRKGKQMTIKVIMLDDTVHNFLIPQKAYGQYLFDEVLTKLNILEADYFGLEYTDQHGTLWWLDYEKPILKQVSAPYGLTFNFCVKFYTPDPGLLEEEYTRYLFALQVRRDLLSGNMPCNENTGALLASFIIQAELGDFIEEEYPDHTYISSFKLIHNQTEELELKIMDHHRMHIGQTPAEADFNLLDTARKVEMYGIKVHNAKDHEGVPLNLAVAHMGVLVFQNYTKINTFSWAKIRKLSFKRKKFLIKLHPEGYGYYKDTVEFYFETRNECKNFWKKCIEHHAFFRCQAVKRLARNKKRVVSKGSSFRYSGRTQKQLVEYVRENYVKRPQFERKRLKYKTKSTSMRTMSASRTPNTSTLNSRDFMMGHNTSTSSGSHILENAGTPKDTSRRGERVETAEVHDGSSQSGKSLGSPKKEHNYGDERLNHEGDREREEELDHVDTSGGLIGELSPRPRHVHPNSFQEKDRKLSAPVLSTNRPHHAVMDDQYLSRSPEVDNIPERIYVQENRDRVFPRFDSQDDSDDEYYDRSPSPGAALRRSQSQETKPPYSDGLISSPSAPVIREEQTVSTPPYPEPPYPEPPSPISYHEEDVTPAVPPPYRDDLSQPLPPHPMEENRPPPSYKDEMRRSPGSPYRENKRREVPHSPYYENHQALSSPSAADRRAVNMVRDDSVTMQSRSTMSASATLTSTGSVTSSRGTEDSEDEVRRSKRYPADKAYYVAKELLMTERTYKKDLEVITVWFRNAISKDEVLPEHVMEMMFSQLDPIYEFHCSFLKEIEQRLAMWEGKSNAHLNGDYQKIGDVMLDNMKVLQLYKNYIDTHEEIISELELALRRNKRFEQVYKDFEAQKVCYLPLNTFLLKPAQRLLHYKLILERLLTHYTVDHPDYRDCKVTLAKIKEVTISFHEKMHNLENMQKLIELQRDLVGIDNLVQASREFIREGCLQKLSKKGYQQRMFFLFSDMLVYASRTATPALQFKVHGQLPLKGMIVEEADPKMAVANSFTIYGGNRCLLVAASSETEKDKWLEDLVASIAAAKERGEEKLQYASLKSNASSDDNLDEGFESAMPKSPPTPEKQIQHRANTTMHVCWHRNTSVSMQDYTRAVQNQLSGYLLRKFKNSNGWQKLWVVFTNFCLFFYKTFQDDFPLASLPLLGYSVTTPAEGDGIHKDYVFKLQFKNHVYFFRAESEYTFERWVEVISSATSSAHRMRMFSRMDSKAPSTP